MTIDHRVKLRIVIRPIGHPKVRILVGDQQYCGQIDQETNFDYDFSCRESTISVSVEHFGKDHNDSETAVEIVAIEFFGISDPKFAWAGVYYPDYPEPWYGQQTPRPADLLPAQTYLGWNGTYRLEFSVPVFEWMHKTLNLGWIYR